MTRYHMQYKNQKETEVVDLMEFFLTYRIADKMRWRNYICIHLTDPKSPLASTAVIPFRDSVL